VNPKSHNSCTRVPTDSVIFTKTLEHARHTGYSGKVYLQTLTVTACMRCRGKTHQLSFKRCAVGCLGASLLMITPVEDVDARPYHACCETKVILKLDENGFEIRLEITDCDNIFHGHWDWGHPFTCPSS